MHLSKALVACLTTLTLGLSASATTTAGSSSAFGVNVTLAGLLPVNVAPIPTVSGSAPAPYNLTPAPTASVSVPGVLGTGVLTLTAASNVDGAPGARFANASADVDNLALAISIPAVLTLGISADSVTANAAVN